MKIVALIMLPFIFTLSISSFCLFHQQHSFEKNAVYSTARVIAPTTLGSHGQSRPVLEFTNTQGELTTAPSQPVKGNPRFETGDLVDIAYTEKHALGRTFYDVFVIRSDQPYAIYKFIGIILAVLAAILFAIMIFLMV